MAQNNLGAAYLKGEGVVRDDAEALRWLNKAADQDVSAAQNTLGGLYCGGDKRTNPIKIDNELCNKWLKSAVALGNEDAKAALKRAECPYVIKDKNGKFVTNLCF